LNIFSLFYLTGSSTGLRALREAYPGSFFGPPFCWPGPALAVAGLLVKAAAEDVPPFAPRAVFLVAFVSLLFDISLAVFGASSA